MRIKNSLNNMIFSFGSIGVSNILNFISRSVFIYTLGSTYLGVSGLFSNILSMLSLAELGISSAINFSLYKPIAYKDDNKISILMGFYKRTYIKIGSLVGLLGFILMFFLKYFIKDSNTIPNLSFIYLLYLFNTVWGYFFSYKTTLLSADQKGYKIAPINTSITVITVLAQIIVLLVTRNYIAYLLTQTVIGSIQMIIINYIIGKWYKSINFKCKEKLPSDELSKIVINVKAMFFHKVGDYCINGTDNIIISSFLSIGLVGFYSNYNLLITTVNSLITIIFNSTSASFGNLIAEESSEKRLEVFKVFNFLGFWIYGWATVCFYNLLNPFISMWIGKSYLLDMTTIAIVLTNYYLVGMRIPMGIVKSSAGIYDQDKYLPLVQSFVNLFFSVILVKKLGLAGVFMGTLISSIFTVCWYRPIIVYRYVFETSSKSYFIKFLFYGVTVLVNVIIVRLACNILFDGEGIGKFIGKILICLIVPNLVVVILYYKTFEFKQFITILKQVLGGITKWRNKLA